MPKKSCMIPDKPGDPGYVVKPGIVMAARGPDHSPFSWEADRMWGNKTWDGMMVPQTFCQDPRGIWRRHQPYKE